MSYSQAEQSLISSVAEHSYSFVKQSSTPYAGYYFSQYVAREFLKLYFHEAHDKHLFDLHLLALQARLESLNLESLKNGIQLTRMHQQMQFLEKEQHKLVFFSPRGTPLVRETPAELSEIPGLDQYQTRVQDYIEQLFDLMAGKLRTPKKQIQNKSQKLFDIYQKLRIQAEMVFEAVLKGASSMDLNKKTEMSDWIKENLTQVLGTPEKSFLERNGFYLLAGFLIIAAAVFFALPYWGMLAFGADIEIVSLYLLVLGALCALMNGLQSYNAVDACEEKYSQLQKI
jgi:hypothetical protein